MNRFCACGKKTTLVVLTLLLLQTLAGSSRAVAQNARRAEEILKAIRRHGESTKSFVFEWNDTPSAVSDDMTALALRHRDEGIKSGDPGRRVDAMGTARSMIAEQQPGSYRLVVDGVRMRFEESTFEPSMTDTSIVVPQERVETFDRKLGKSLTAKSAGRYPRGRVAPTNETKGLDFVGSLPIVVALRNALWLDRLAAGRTTVIDGTLDDEPMVILTLSWEKNGWTYTLWCDPARDYHVRRIERHLSSVLRSRYDISYSHDQKSGLWIPVQWNRISARSDGTIQVQKTSTVTYYSLGGEISSEEFELTFPPGTWVEDTVNNRSYIVLEDGGQRFVTPAERAAGLGYEEILERSPRPISPHVWIMSLSTIALIGLLFFVWRSYRHRPARGF